MDEVEDRSLEQDATELGPVEPRRLIPTARELQEGLERAEYEFDGKKEGEDEGGFSFRRLVRNWLRDADPRTIKGPTLPLFVLGATSILAGWDDQALAILLPEIQADFGLTLQFLATFGTIFGVAGRLSGLPFGWLADRIKRVWMVRTGAITSNIGTLLLATSNSIPQMVGARAIAGIAGMVHTPASLPLMTDYYSSSARARVLSFLSMAAIVGALLGQPIAGSLAESFGWRSSVFTLAILGFVVSLLTFLLKEPKRGYVDRIEQGASEKDANKEEAALTFGESWRATMSIGTVRRLSYATIFLQLAGLPIGLLLALYWAQVFALGPAARGYIATAGSAFALLGLMYAAPVADRLIRYRPGRIMTLVGVLGFAQAGSLVVLAVSPSVWLAIAVSLPLAAIGAVFLPAFFTLVSLVVPARVRGFGIQLMNLFAVPPLLAFPFLIGLAANVPLQTAILYFIPFMVIGSLIVFSASPLVAGDIRAVMASALAEKESDRARDAGLTKMIVARDVDVTYDGVQVLFGVDLDVNAGEIVALVGTNGAGKSTLLRAIAGIQEASNGAIFLNGRDITHVPPYENARNGIVVMPGGEAIFPTLTVEENLQTAAWMYREDSEYVAVGMEKVLGFFPILRERWGQLAGTLSGGEQQMVALGQAFLMKPRLLMIDELSLGLAPQIVDRLLETVKEIHESGTTVVLVEQSLNVALSVAERAVFMEKGEVRFDGPTAELLRRPELVRSVFMGGAVSAAGGRAASRKSRETILEVEGVSIAFGGVQALSKAGLSLAAGEVVGIIGPNGAGKTTLFDVISGFLQPDEGKVVLDNVDVSDLPSDARARLGFGRSFQNVRLFPAMTVRENIAVARERHVPARNPIMAAFWTPQTRKVERRVARFVDNLIHQLGLDAYADKFVDELSTGTRRAVDVACVMAAEPRVLLLDEPSSGLAQAESEDLGPLLLRLVRETGCGMLVIEHDVPLITSISDRMYAMDLGEVIASGTPQQVQSDTRVVASYLSASTEALARSDIGAAAAAAFGLDKDGKES